MTPENGADSLPALITRPTIERAGDNLDRQLDRVAAAELVSPNRGSPVEARGDRIPVSFYEVVPQLVETELREIAVLHNKA